MKFFIVTILNLAAFSSAIAIPQGNASLDKRQAGFIVGALKEGVPMWIGGLVDVLKHPERQPMATDQERRNGENGIVKCGHYC
jgi:hypothetical protein